MTLKKYGVKMKDYKMLRIRLSSWNKIRREFYGRKDENFSDYIERVAKYLKEWRK